MENPNTLGLLGETIEVDNATLNTTERLACRLYDIQTETDVNVPKNNKFCQEKTPDPQQLTPTRNELWPRVKGCNYWSLEESFIDQS